MTTNSPKPGWKTTEFWAVMIANVAILLSAVTGWLPADWACAAAAVADGLYAVGRGLAKQGTATNDTALKEEVMRALVNRIANGGGSTAAGSDGVHPRDPAAGG
jgi:hypothetical protein